MPGKGSDVLPALTSLRFFAAFWVVLFHLGLPALHRWPGPFRVWMSRGWLGVPFFFVLSGFILVHVYGAALRRGALDRRGFWWARFARVYPMYAVALVIAFPFFVLTQRLPGHESVTNGVLEVVSTGLLVQTWFPWLSITWNTPGWSLSVEAFFYAIFPLLGAAVVKLRRPWALALAFLVVGVVGQWELARLPQTLAWHNFASGFPPVWLPFFLFGCALAQVRYSMDQAGRRVPSALAWLAVLACVLVLCFDPHKKAPLSVAMLVAEGLFGAIILGFSWPVAGGGWLAGRAMQALGEASYALYLLHIPMYAWASRVWGHPAGHTIPELALLVAITITASLVAHYAIERPARTALRRIRGLAPVPEGGAPPVPAAPPTP